MWHTFSTLWLRKVFWRTLKLAMNSYSCLAFILTRAIGMSPVHPRAALPRLPTRHPKEHKWEGLTKDRVHDLTICATGPALFNLGEDDLRGIAELGEKFGAGLSHR